MEENMLWITIASVYDLSEGIDEAVVSFRVILFI